VNALNALIPITLLVAAAAACIHFAACNPILVLSPMFWLLATCALYYGWGALLYQYGSHASIDYVQGYYRIDDRTLLRTNQLNIACLFAVCLSFVVALRMFPLRWSGGESVFTRRLRDEFIGMCLIIGLPIRYIVVPLNGSQRLGFFIPSQILELEDLFLIALTLMTWSFLIGERKWRVILACLFGWEFIVALVGGGKLFLVMLVLSVFLGVFLARPTHRTLLVGVLLGIISWSTLVTVTKTIRTGSLAGQGETLSQRMGLAFSAMERRRDDGDRSTTQGWWTRLCYAPGQGFCIHRYDAGDPGQTIKLWYWAFVPRLLVPEKPETTPGRMFNILVTGNGNSRSSPGLFAEAYWNGGWPLALACSAFVGVLLLALTHVALWALLGADYRWLPLVWTGMYMGLRVDDWAVANFLGAWPIALATCFFLRMVFPTSVLRIAKRQPVPQPLVADYRNRRDSWTPEKRNIA